MPRAPLDTRAIIAAAADLADDEGFEAVTVSAVARRVGVKPASVYSHVAGLAALRRGVHELALDELADRVGEAVAGRTTRDALGGLADAHRDFADEKPGRWSALQQPASEETARSAGAMRVSGLLVGTLRGYQLPDSALVHASRLVGATINGYLALEAGGGFAHRTQATTDSWTTAIDALDRALRTWPDREERRTP
jgi:AcrR family transcriptional regulator